MATRCALLLVLALLSAHRPLSAQTQAPDSTIPRNQPPGLMAPLQVGRYMRGAMHDYGEPAGGVAYQYAPVGADSNYATLYLYQRDTSTGTWMADSAVASQVATFKEALTFQRSRGVYDDYSIAFEGPDTVTAGGHVIHGYSLSFAYKRRGQIAVSFFYLFPVGDAFVKVRGTVPAEAFHTSDLPQFAHDVTVAAIRPR